MSRANLIALDAATGTPAAGFGTNGAADVGVPYGGTPTIFENVAIIGAASGEVPQGPPGNPRAFDVRTGAKLWEFQTVPRAGEPFNETWGNGWEGRGGTNMWGFAAPVDADRGLAYLPIAGPAANYYGGDRPGNNVFANSIVAVDARTGQYRWHFQTVHHDLWDIDMPSAGGLFELERNGTRVPAIAHVGKSAYFYVLDRATGEPLHEVERRRSRKATCRRNGTRRRSRFPFARRRSRASASATPTSSTAEDTTPEHAAACRDFMARSGGFYNAGPFTPFMYKAPDAPPKSTIQFPGGTGGVNWGGVAVDPTTGYVFATSHDGALVGWVQDKDPNVTYSFEAVGSKQPYDRASINGVGPFFTFSAPLSGQYDANGQGVGPSAPCQRPPWGKLVAVNAKTGEIAWESVLGLNEALPEGKQLVGSAGSAGPERHGGRRRVRRRDERSALPRVRCEDRQRALERDAREQRRRESDELRGPQRQATRRDRRGRHRQRVRSAVSGRNDAGEAFTYDSRGIQSQNNDLGDLHAALQEDRSDGRRRGCRTRRRAKRRATVGRGGTPRTHRRAAEHQRRLASHEQRELEPRGALGGRSWTSFGRSARWRRFRPARASSTATARSRTSPRRSRSATRIARAGRSRIPRRAVTCPAFRAPRTCRFRSRSCRAAATFCSSTRTRARTGS